jgi:hypothetical protein
VRVRRGGPRALQPQDGEPFGLPAPHRLSPRAKTARGR